MGWVSDCRSIANQIRAAADDIDQQEHDGDDQQDVEQSAQRILCQHAKEPEDDEDDDDADHVDLPEHDTSEGGMISRMLPSTRLSRRDVLNLTGLASLASLSPMTVRQTKATSTASPGSAPPRAVRTARRPARPRAADRRHEARRGGARRVRARDVGPGSQRDRDGAGLSRPPALDRPGASRPSFSTIHTAAATRSASRSSSKAASYLQPVAVCEGPDGSRLRGALHRLAGCSASAATRPRPTCSRPCCGGGRCCGE